MKHARLIVGILVVFVALWIIVSEQTSGASANAIVNARLSTVRTPITGIVQIAPRPLGSIVREGEALATVNDPLVDNVRLDDLALDLDLAATEVARLEQEVEATQNMIETLSARMESDQADRLAEAEQRLIELHRVLASLEADLNRAEARAEAVAARIDRERLRVNRSGVAELSSPVDGILWEVLSSTGEVVQSGQDVMRLLDCNSLMVTLSVTENVYNRLSQGDAATFTPRGHSEVFDATVTRLAGAGALAIYQNLAVAPSEQDLERYDVTITVPGLRSDPDLSCAVGRTGRVFFERRPLDWLRSFWS